jgi:hypothetical protein
MTVDSGAATVIAALVGAVPATVAAVAAFRAAGHAKRAGSTAERARASATSAAESVMPNGRGTVMQLLERVDDKVDELALQKARDHKEIHERITATGTLIAHYLGAPPPGLEVPPPPASRARRPRRRPQHRESKP